MNLGDGPCVFNVFKRGRTPNEHQTGDIGIECSMSSKEVEHET